MGRSEIFASRKFDEHVIQEGESKPIEVIKQSRKNLESHLINNSLLEIVIANDYLKNYTIPFIDTAMNAVPMTDTMLQRMSAVSYLKMRQFVANDQPLHTLQEQFEAFDLTNVIFARMPQYFLTSQFPMGFSKSGSLRPPQTVGGFINRLSEMRNTVHTLITEGLEDDLPYLRTIAFFHVGSELPFTTEKSRSKSEFIDGEFSAA